MNRPPLPTIPSTKHTRRPGQNLASLAPCLRGAALLPVIPKISQPESWILVKRTDVSGEGGKNFILHRSLHQSTSPSSSAKRREKNGVSKLQHKKAPKNEAPKRAGATPLFGLQSAQKVFEVAPARFGSQTRHAAGQKSQVLRMHYQRSAVLA
jgi:hypothetical protein